MSSFGISIVGFTTVSSTPAATSAMSCTMCSVMLDLRRDERLDFLPAVGAMAGTASSTTST